ncbi:ubiquitin carboxyl-terminal hydrolase 37-like [Archocentrus centrarchus]|uniref:ubiquitin carboxyl-terminal hydrolase 37-like n=1 Tax=Archocentrus centrarchus TaxID=63155 RepID=UPI0011EA2E63|nr:ubiquitin carboxyl-terminal hydrolase 37-like [Archocentrus centrarchus]
MNELTLTLSPLCLCVRFPNIGNSCYMNSCLQSLLSIQDFICDISCQKDLWSSVPEAQLLRRLIDIRDCRESTDYGVKNSRLWSFKRAFATYALDYGDSRQKDAHEFLMLLVNHIQMMSPHLQQHAAVLGQSYTCPVEGNFFFQMENTRTCKSCGVQSSHKEDFTGLSLDLVPEGSIMGMLEVYLKEKELEFRCECGGMISGMESSFDSLPRVLILHLKRFCITLQSGEAA